MSLWTQTQHLPHESLQKVQTLYGDHFPIEVRHFLAEWIEERMCSYPNVPEHAQLEHSQRFLEGLITELQSRAEMMVTQEMFVTKMKLVEASEYFRTKYSAQPHQLYMFLQGCLSKEYQLVNALQSAAGYEPVLSPGYKHNAETPEFKHSELLTALQTLHQSVSTANHEVRSIESQQESFALQFHECTKHKAHQEYLKTRPMTNERREMEAMLRAQIENLERELSTMVPQLIQAQLNLSSRLKSNITTLGELQSRVLDVELIRWKREQQLSGNGAQMPSYLNAIQEWCEHLADLTWQSRQQVKDAERLSGKLDCIKTPGQPELLQDLSKQVTSLLSTLVTSTFVIEKQPPQVMKTNTRFTATVRLLVGGQLNVFMTPPQVKVMIISEAQAQTLLKSDARNKQPTEMCGEILNNTGTMEYQQANKQLSVSFRNMQLRKIKRAEKKGTESVMDEKLTLLFSSQFNVGGGELVFQVWTLSLPVVVIVHGNQEPHGWATVTWDNAFSAPGRVPFAVPEKVTWDVMAKTLNLKFCSATGSPLSEDNLRFLAEKMFRTNLPASVTQTELNGMMVSWAQFCKEPLPERNFTFWEWFYMVMKVTREHLRNQWADGLIIGFIQKKQAEDMLARCPPGTFLLRFSDSEPGGITIAWVTEGNPPEVFSLQPFTSRDLTLRGVADRVSDLAPCVHLYPDILKDQAFGKYYTLPEKPTPNGYVKPLLVTHLPWLGPGRYGGTPHHASSPSYNVQSPDSQRDTPSVHSSYTESATPAMLHLNSSMEYQVQEHLADFDEYMEGLGFDLPPSLQ